MNIQTAAELRFSRGLRLPIDKPYDNLRLQNIAIRQLELFRELDELDSEILAMYNTSNNTSCIES